MYRKCKFCWDIPIGLFVLCFLLMSSVFWNEELWWVWHACGKFCDYLLEYINTYLPEATVRKVTCDLRGWIRENVIIILDIIRGLLHNPSETSACSETIWRCIPEGCNRNEPSYSNACSNLCYFFTYVLFLKMV